MYYVRCAERFPMKPGNKGKNFFVIGFQAIAPGMGAVMSRRAARAFSRGRRPTAGGPTHRGGAGGAEMPVQPEANLSGQPGPAK